MSETTPTEGWGWPLNARKAHYFLEGRSLCMRWMFFGTLVPDPADKTSPDDCKTCTKRLKQRQMFKEVRDRLLDEQKTKNTP